jgi:hypothetical protein
MHVNPTGKLHLGKEYRMVMQSLERPTLISTDPVPRKDLEQVKK